MANQPSQSDFRESAATHPWQKFKQHRLAHISLWLLIALFILSIAAPLISNEQPFLVHYQNQMYVPFLTSYPETTFGGSFYTPTDYQDPFILGQFKQAGNWAIYPLNPFSQDTLSYGYPEPAPAAPSAIHLLGTDDHGRDVLARLIYSVRTSLAFAVLLALISSVIGVAVGAIQGFFGGKIDLYLQRFLEVWSSFPELYIWMIFASIFQPSVVLLLILLSLFSWVSIAEYMRMEVLKTKQMDYVKIAKVMGVPNATIIKRHILPNVLVPVITWFPFRVSAGMLALTALDFLGIGLPSNVSTLGELLTQSKNNLEAWWIMLPTLGCITVITLSLTFIAEGLRQAYAIKK